VSEGRGTRSAASRHGRRFSLSALGVGLLAVSRSTGLPVHRSTGRIEGNVVVSTALAARRPDFRIYADPGTGYRIRVDGKSMVFGGTSAVAPLMAGLVARCAQKGGATPRDFISRVYTAETTAVKTKVKLPDFFDVTEGTNNGYTAKEGWDACTGLGVPVGTRVLKNVYGKG